MKNKLKKILSLAFCGIMLTTTIIYANSKNEAGSSDDPLVTKSYVDEKVSQVIKLINDTISGDTHTDDSKPQASSSSYQSVLVEVSQGIYGDAGTELILRSGKGTAVVPTREGISNITKGKDIKNGEAISKNELIIIPRKDGRGVKVTEKAWFLVKGGYEIR